jgi:predicted transcriptional regulator
MYYERKFKLRHKVWRKKNRGHFEIIASMLEAVRNDDRALYPLMKYMGSNYAELKKYLKSLTEVGFIEADTKEGRVLYKASEKGLNFLRQYYVLLGMLLNTPACENMVLPRVCAHTY